MIRARQPWTTGHLSAHYGSLQRGSPALPRAALVLSSALGLACAPPPPSEWTLELVESTTIGAEPVSLESAFYFPADLGFDAAGNVYVLDRGNGRIQVFSPEGRFARSVARPGQGPGELSSPEGMWVFADGALLVADTRNRRLHPFDASGRPGQPWPLEFFPLDVVVHADRVFVLRLPRASMVFGPDPSALVHVFDRDRHPLDAFVAPSSTRAGAVYLLENSLRLAPAPEGVALADTHRFSRIRWYGNDGALRKEIPVLYKAGAWAPLGRRPAAVNETSLQGIARTASDLAWDPRRRLFWVLAGYVDRTPEGEWISGREIYRYDPYGSYRGSVMLKRRMLVVEAGPGGRIWTIDDGGAVHGYIVRDPETAPRSKTDREADPQGSRR